MKKTPIAAVLPGEIVARPVVSGSGVTLVQPGAALTAEMVERLKNLGVDTVWLEGEAPGAKAREQLLAELDRRFAGHEADPLMMELKSVVASLVGQEAGER